MSKTIKLKIEGTKGNVGEAYLDGGGTIFFFKDSGEPQYNMKAPKWLLTLIETEKLRAGSEAVRKHNETIRRVIGA